MKFLVIILILSLIVIFLIFIFKILKIKKVYFDNFQDNLIELHLCENQKYFISIFEGYYKSDSGAIFILHEKSSNEIVQLKKCYLKYQFFYDGLKGFDYYSFKSKKSGKYILEIKNSNLLELEFTNLWIKKILHTNKNELQRRILIRESVNQKEFLFLALSFLFLLLFLILIITIKLNLI